MDAREYYDSLKDQYVVGQRGKIPVLHPMLDGNVDSSYQLGRGNDRNIDVTKFIKGFDASNGVEESEYEGDSDDQYDHTTGEMLNTAKETSEAMDNAPSTSEDTMSVEEGIEEVPANGTQE